MTMHLQKYVRLGQGQARVWCEGEGCDFSAVVPDTRGMIVGAMYEHLNDVDRDRQRELRQNKVRDIRILGVVFLLVILAIAIWSAWMSGVAW